jgi:hypothetical protein
MRPAVMPPACAPKRVALMRALPSATMRVRPAVVRPVPRSCQTSPEVLPLTAAAARASVQAASAQALTVTA